MSIYKEILNQATLQHLSHLIRDTKLKKLTLESFSKREEIACKNLYKNLKEFLNQDQIYNIESIINEYTSELCEIYFNTGIKTGAKLMHQLLDNEDKDY